VKNLSRRIIKTSESLLTKWDSEIKETAENGKDIISLNAGQPDFSIPSVIEEEICEVASEKGNNSYTPVEGIAEVRETVSLFQEKVFSMDYRPKEIILTNGAKEGIFLSLGALTDPGDEIVIIAPYWSTYREIINFFGGKPVVANTNKDFHLNIKEIENVAIKTKAVIINSPNNPSGAIYTERELERLAEIAKRYDLYVISDEIYGSIRYNHKNHCSIASVKGMKERTVVVNGFSKVFATTGYRLGYTLSSEEIAKAMLKIKSNSTGNTNSFFQMVITNILSNSFNRFDKLIASSENMRKEFGRRRNFLCRKLDELGIEYAAPEGAFYVFARIPDKFRIASSEKFSRYLLDKTGVAVAPGIFFGDNFDDFIRISFASSMENIKEAMERMKKII